MLQLHRKDSGMIFITHDMGVVYKMADRVAVMYAGQIVEQADAKDFFAGPKHPYARALLEALPSHATRGRRLKAIPGQVPSPGNFAKGCRFAERSPPRPLPLRPLRAPVGAQRTEARKRKTERASSARPAELLYKAASAAVLVVL